ncbi:MAG: sterol desaturase family protein [Pseudobdellovibrionaceae bacterium]
MMVLFFILNEIVVRTSPNRQISKTRPSRQAYLRDFKNFLLANTFGFFFAILLQIFLSQKGWLKAYNNPETYGWSYYYFSIFLVIIFHDIYFYLFHRLFHHPLLYRFHRIHHESRVISPLSSVAFHPLEAFFVYSFISIFLLVFPLHTDVIVAYSWVIALVTVHGHSGVVHVPKFMMRGKWARAVVTSYHHSLHHKYPNCNFGLYFNFMDRIFETEHPYLLKSSEEFADSISSKKSGQT